MQKVVVIYHKDCIDGTTAAAVVLRRFPEAKLFPLLHDPSVDDLEKVLAIIDSDTDIYTVDCGIGVQEILSRGFKVMTIDHHVGVKDSLDLLVKENTNFTYLFDNEKSGASLAWQYFFPDEELPEIIKLVEDSDLWKGQFGEDTKNVNNYLWLFINEPDKILQILEGDLNEVKKQGKVISIYAEKEIMKLVEIPAISLKIGEHIFPAYNITNHESACGNILSEKNNQTAVMFTIKGDVVKFSFRSKAGQNLSALDLAKILGGNGHVLAAGARVPLSEFMQMIV
ncbi:MAG: phosphoesterase [Candidatus Pacebacteria bacterium]|nr:phosphoesterase [Candidatus Paceibacterota bacterium]